jgi:DNA replication protein DnaC
MIEEEKEREIQKYLFGAGVGRKFLKANLTDFKQKIDLSGKIQSLYIYGPRGTGKTHFLAALAREIYLKDLPGFYFVSVPDMLLLIRKNIDKSSTETINYAGTTQSDPWNDRSHKILFLDDLGTEKLTDWALSTIYTIIDGRYRNCLLTFISSNYSLDQISDRIDDRVSSRLAEMCEVIKLTGKDRRVN